MSARAKRLEATYLRSHDEAGFSKGEFILLFMLYIVRFLLCHHYILLLFIVLLILCVLTGILGGRKKEQSPRRLTEQCTSLLLLCCMVWVKGTPLKLPRRPFCVPLWTLDLSTKKKSYKTLGICTCLSPYLVPSSFLTAVPSPREPAGNAECCTAPSGQRDSCTSTPKTWEMGQKGQAQNSL